MIEINTELLYSHGFIFAKSPCLLQVCSYILQSSCQTRKSLGIIDSKVFEPVSALAVLEIFDSERVLENVVARGVELERLCAEMASRHPVVASQRGRGLLRGLVLREGVDPAAVLARVREHGVLATLAGGNVLRISPALTITAAELAEGMAQVDRALAELSAEMTTLSNQGTAP